MEVYQGISKGTAFLGTLMPPAIKNDRRVGLHWDSADLRAEASCKSIKQPFLLNEMLSRGHSNLGWKSITKTFNLRISLLTSWNISESGIPLLWWKGPDYQNTNSQVSYPNSFNPVPLSHRDSPCCQPSQNSLQHQNCVCCENPSDKHWADAPLAARERCEWSSDPDWQR